MSVELIAILATGGPLARVILTASGGGSHLLNRVHPYFGEVAESAGQRLVWLIQGTDPKGSK